MTIDESNYANQIYQMQVGLNTQKMKVDKELTDEMIKHFINKLSVGPGPGDRLRRDKIE